MSLATRARVRTGSTRPAPAPRSPGDVLFAVAVGLLLVVHVVIFGATLVLAPVTPLEQRSLELLQLPVEVARAMMLPFHALLLASLYVLGSRVAGRWAGFGSMLAVLALDLRGDATAPVFGPAVATGGWAAAALLAAAMVLLARRPRAAALLVGAASGFAGLLVLALPAFLLALGLQPRHGTRGARVGALVAFTGCFALAATIVQAVWLARLGPAGWLTRAAEYTAEFRPHDLVPWLEQQRIVFGEWHFSPGVTVSLALFLFVAAGVGAVRYLVVPLPAEDGPAVVRVLRRFPPGLTAGFVTMLLFGVWWAFSGAVVVVDPMLPVLGAVAPLLTALAYRGAKWLLTVNRFWAVSAVLYLIGLILARSTQLIITLVQAFQY